MEVLLLKKINSKACWFREWLTLQAWFATSQWSFSAGNKLALEQEKIQNLQDNSNQVHMYIGMCTHTGEKKKILKYTDWIVKFKYMVFSPNKVCNIIPSSV